MHTLSAYCKNRVAYKKGAVQENMGSKKSSETEKLGEVDQTMTRNPVKKPPLTLPPGRVQQEKSILFIDMTIW
jgi:hypothetical protein